MKTKLKPRQMWVDPDLYSRDENAEVFSSDKCFPTDLRVAVIPLDDVDALLAAANSAYGTEPTMSCMNGMIAALTAIGVLPKKRKGQK